MTALTVANICSFNPGLGPINHPLDIAEGRIVYWDNNHDGVIDFGAYNYEGDSRVDVAFVFYGTQLEWLGWCSPRETAWMNVPVYEREREEKLSGNVNLTPEAWNTYRQILANEAGIAAVWANPEPSVGTIFLNSEGQCDSYYQYCRVEPGHY